MRSLVKNKKGELTDMLIWLITIFILGIGLFILMFIIPSITGGLRTAGLNNSVEGANAITSMDGLGNIINNGFLMLFVGLIISVMITSFMVRTHPIFLFLYIIFLAITVLLSFYLGNAYYQLIGNPTFASMVNTATFSNWILGHIAEITVAVGALSMIIVFAKFSSSGGGQQF
jgi:hypothetical protein